MNNISFDSNISKLYRVESISEWFVENMYVVFIILWFYRAEDSVLANSAEYTRAHECEI